MYFLTCDWNGFHRVLYFQTCLRAPFGKRTGMQRRSMVCYKIWVTLLGIVVTNLAYLVLSLNTDGCASLDASFVEATKTSFTIESLPSVLLIQLKHWKYNTQTRSLEKVAWMIVIMAIAARYWYSYTLLQIYDPYTYPQELDMGLYLDKKNNASGECHKYVLFR